MNIKVDLKKLFAAAVSAIMCLSAGGCYLLPDEEEVLDAPTVKASDVTYSTVTAKKKDLEKKIVATGTVTAENQYTLSYEKQSGTVSKFYVKAGDKVKKGDVFEYTFFISESFAPGSPDNVCTTGRIVSATI